MTRKKSAQSGNVFFIILVGVALFGALTFTMSRSMRSENTNELSEREVKLFVADILDYGQKLSRAVDRLRRRGCSENDISFENAMASGYVNASAPGDNSCHVFHADGGKMTWKTPPVSGYVYQFFGSDAVQNLGTAGSEIIMALEGVSQSLCTGYNKELGLGSSIASGAGDEDLAKFQGTFADTLSITETAGQQAACFDADGNGSYFLYYVILER